MGRREKIEIERSREERVEKEDGILTGKLCLGREWWRLVEVYVNKDLEEKMEKLRKWIEDREEGVRMLIGGDFNARKGKIGGRVGGESEEGFGRGGRRSKNEKVNGEGKRLYGLLEDLGWSILNGNVKGDEEGEWTYVGGKGGTVDYVLRNEETWEKVRRIRIEDKVDSDRQPVTVWVEGSRSSGGVGKRKRGQVGGKVYRQRKDEGSLKNILVVNMRVERGWKRGSRG